MTTGCYMLIIILLIQFQSWPVLGKTGVLWLWASDKQWKFWGPSFHSLHSLDKMRPSDFEPYSIWLSKRGDVTKTKKSHHLNFCTLFFCYWVALCLMLFWVMELRGGRIWPYFAKIFSHFPCFRGCFAKLCDMNWRLSLSNNTTPMYNPPWGFHSFTFWLSWRLKRVGFLTWKKYFRCVNK